MQRAERVAKIFVHSYLKCRPIYKQNTNCITFVWFDFLIVTLHQTSKFHVLHDADVMKPLAVVISQDVSEMQVTCILSESYHYIVTFNAIFVTTQTL